MFHYGMTRRKEPKIAEVSVRYEMLISQDLSREARYSTLAYELAHLYCGHLGTPNRRGLGKNVEEFEKQCVAHLVYAAGAG
jgi:hypothetical protein